MLTRSEKTYLALTLAFLAAGFGIKAWRHATVRLGPFPDPETLAQDSARSADSLAGAGSQAAAGSLAQAQRATDPGDTSFASADAGITAPSSLGPGELARSHAGAEHGKSPKASGEGGKIDLNRADAAALMRVKGIGAKTAEAILAWRRIHGPFRDIRDLLNIKGIGEKKLEKLGPHIIL